MEPATVIPAIIPDSLESLKMHLTSLAEVTSVFQVDIVDGKFVPFVSWPYNDRSEPKAINSYIEGLKIEFDLMIQNPEVALPEWLMTNAERFVIHIESTRDLPQCIALVKDAKKKIGIALNNETSFSGIEEHIAEIDFVQCMGIAEIGKQGNSFDDRVLLRVEEIKKAYPGLEITVDGSINVETIERVHEAGATRLVSGSAILESDSPIGTYNELLKRVS